MLLTNYRNVIQMMHYWHRSTITRWWSADILCCLALFVAIFLILANLLANNYSSSELLKPHNPYQKVNTAQKNAKKMKLVFAYSHETQAAITANSEKHRAIFALQDAGKWKEADSLIADLPKDDLLRGHILAQRYLHKDYTTSPAELSRWMAEYHDHPQAARIYRLGQRKGAAKLQLPTAQKKLSGSGYSQPAVRKEYSQWKRGLTAWKRGDYATAYKQFAAFAERKDKKLKHWDKAAGHFWAYRAAKKLKSERNASNHLRIAAKHPGSFYGVQASKLLRQDIFAASEHFEIANAEVISDFAPALRAHALVHAASPQLASQELRYGYYRADSEQKYALLALAEQLELPAIQIRLASQLFYRRNHDSLNPALYPTPGWEPHTGYAVDPALLFAVARQESGFDSSARSYAGAEGVMQIMPRTANYIVKRIDPALQQLTSAQKASPSLTGLTLGQSYLRYLLDRPYVGNNLVYLTIAYNAGAANLLKWKKSLPQNDPLLFIESIPYKETRNYVLNVLANYWIYQERMGHSPKHAYQLASGQWPIYDGSEQQLAQAISALSD